MSGRNQTSHEPCDCKASGHVLKYNDCAKCCERAIHNGFCDKDRACVYRKSAALSRKKTETCPCKETKSQLAHLLISKREKCLDCCNEKKFTFNRFISICEMNPDCIINMYKTCTNHGMLLPEIQNENMPKNLMVDKNMEANDSDREHSNPRSILVAKPPTVPTKYNPQPTRLSAWSNRGPSIIWSYYDPEGSTKDDVRPLLLPIEQEAADAKKNGGRWYREINRSDWNPTKMIDTETLPSTPRSSNSKDYSKVLSPKASDESTQIGESSSNPSSKRKSISFAQPIDSPKMSRMSSGAGVEDTDFSVLNQVIAQQGNDSKKNSVESVRSNLNLGKMRCAILLNSILPWRWKCFKRKRKIEIRRSHSATSARFRLGDSKYHYLMVDGFTNVAVPFNAETMSIDSNTWICERVDNPNGDIEYICKKLQHKESQEIGLPEVQSKSSTKVAFASAEPGKDSHVSVKFNRMDKRNISTMIIDTRKSIHTFFSSMTRQSRQKEKKKLMFEDQPSVLLLRKSQSLPARKGRWSNATGIRFITIQYVVYRHFDTKLSWLALHIVNIKDYEMLKFVVKQQKDKANEDTESIISSYGKRGVCGPIVRLFNSIKAKLNKKKKRASKHSTHVIKVIYVEEDEQSICRSLQTKRDD
nr:unnamed protein product [Callosobruchus analis]